MAGLLRCAGLAAAGPLHGSQGVGKSAGRRSGVVPSLVAALLLATLGLVGSPAAAGATRYLYWDEHNVGSGGASSSDIARESLSPEAFKGGFIRKGTLGDSLEHLGVAVDGTHLYWAYLTNNAIARANLDGTAPAEIVKGASEPVTTAVDRHHIYWANTSTPTIGRANLDGTAANESFIVTHTDTHGVAVNNRYIYWTAPGENEIGRANLDGTGVNREFLHFSLTPRYEPTRLAVDDAHIYWADKGTNAIGRANLDGTGVNQQFIVTGEPAGVAVDGEFIYFANNGREVPFLERTRLDGSGRETIGIGAGGGGGVKTTVRSLAVTTEPPTLETKPASAITQTTATLNASVNPHGRELEECTLEYGTTGGYGSNVPCAPEPGTAASPVSVSATIGGLTANTEYHFRISGANIAGAGAGSDQTFRTPVKQAQTITFTSSAPVGATVGGPAYTVMAEASSHLPVGFSIDAASSAVCTISGSTVSFIGSGTCTIDASQGGNSEYEPAPQAQQSFPVMPGGPPEVGQCLSAAVGEGKPTTYSGGYSDKKCTKPNTTQTGKYKWVPGPGPRPSFAVSVGATTLETVGKAQVKCTSGTGSGQYQAVKTETITLTFTGCSLSSSQAACQSEGRGSGEVETAALVGELGFIKGGAKPTVGVDLAPSSSTGNVMQFSCGPTSVNVGGSIVAPISSTDKMASSFTVKAKAAKGIQRPEGFEGAGKDTLTWDSGLGQEQLGLTSAVKIVGEESVEIKAV
jgi:hypothetical protein